MTYLIMHVCTHMFVARHCLTMNNIISDCTNIYMSEQESSSILILSMHCIASLLINVIYFKIPKVCGIKFKTVYI